MWRGLNRMAPMDNDCGYCGALLAVSESLVGT